MELIFFADQDEFRRWLQENHQTKKELQVGYYKKSSGKPSMTWSESVDQALCFGWIDGVRNTVDDECYTIRFTPRKPLSNWSEINIKKVESLIEAGLMMPAGLTLFNNRRKKPAGYSYENKPTKLPDEYEAALKKNEKAWDFFSVQPPSYRKMIYLWILSAKQQKTQLSRLEKLIRSSEDGTRIY